MLIASDRHKPADLALWAELEEADRVVGSLHRIDAHARRSLEAIAGFAAAGPCYASTSWGKDSMVMCHLVHIAAPRTPLYHFKVRGHEFAETDATRDAFLAMYPMDYHEIECEAERSGCGWDVKAAQLDAARQVPEPVRRRWIYGLRLQESAVRKMFFRKFGLSCKSSCGPIGWWSTADVFGYLAREGLPVHPSYAMLGGGRWPRERLRVAPVGGTMGEQFGRRAWEREYYGDVIRRLEATA